MKVLILGTGGADGIPALYGSTRVDQIARSQKGKEVRSRSAAIVDDHLKIDLGPDTWNQCVQNSINPNDWSSLFITHSDDDHLTLSEIQYALFPFVSHEKLEFTIYCSQQVKTLIQSRYPKWPIDIVALQAFSPVRLLKYEVTPIRATHKPDEECFNYIFHDGQKSFLYGTDTGIYCEETFEYLAGKRIDAMVLECSDGHHKTPYLGHMDLVQCLHVVERLRASNAVAENAQIFTTHHTSKGDASHSELEEILAPYRMQPAFDGMLMEI